MCTSITDIVKLSFYRGWTSLCLIRSVSINTTVEDSVEEQNWPRLIRPLQLKPPHGLDLLLSAAADKRPSGWTERTGKHKNKHAHADAFPKSIELCLAMSTQQ